MPDTPQQRFEALTLKQVQDALDANAPVDTALAAVAFYNGDAWQDGAGWIGARPPADSPQSGTMMAAIEAALVSENTIGEIVDRHAAGVLSREPRWGFVLVRPLQQDEQPTDSEQALIDEAEALVTHWWDLRRPHETMKTALKTGLLASRAPVRVFIPADFIADGGTIRAEDPQSAIEMVFIDTPDPAKAAVLIDANSRREIGVYSYTRYEESSFLNVTPSGSGDEVIEVSYINDDGTTALRILGSGGVLEEANPPFALDRHILVHDFIRPPLITIQVQQLQKAINLADTQMMRNVNLAGSLERILVNLMPPGEYVDSSGKPWVEGRSTGDRTFKPQNLPVGAGVSAFLHGYEVKNEKGEVTGYSNGTINYRDPVPVTTFKDTRDTLYTAILGQVGQVHALISRDATASGDSRQQARAEYETTLADSAGPLNALGRWLIETVLGLAAILVGQPDRYVTLRCDFETIVDSGPLGADDRREIVNEFTSGVFSHETTLSRLDSDDVDAELERIAAEEEANRVNAFGPVFGNTTPGTTPPLTDGTPPPTGGTGAPTNTTPLPGQQGN